MEEKYYEGAEVGYPRNYGQDVEPVRENEITREYSRLMKAINELGMTCENLEGAFAPVLRQELGKVGIETGTKEPGGSTAFGMNLAQARQSIERITTQVRGILERKEI